jgi:hypothetical protein
LGGRLFSPEQHGRASLYTRTCTTRTTRGAPTGNVSIRSSSAAVKHKLNDIVTSRADVLRGRGGTDRA